MGKAGRSRPRSFSSPSPLPIDVAEKMRKPGMRNSKAAAAGSRNCTGKSVVLSLLVTFGLVVFTVFVFTVRTGHGNGGVVPGKSAGRKTIMRRTKAEFERKIIEGPEKDDGGVGVYGYEIVREFNHDPAAFTQGLAYGGNGTLYESTGLYGQSSVREVDLLTGQVRRSHQMNTQSFGEGLTIWKDRLLQVVWRQKSVYIYDMDTLAPHGELSHGMQDGWGLTANNDHIIGSDGSSKLYFMNPDTFAEVKVLTVKDEEKEVGWLNELEYVNDEIWANIWQGNCIARISPQDGKVTGWILLHGLRNGLLAAGVQGIDVLNGIAWDSKEDKVYVTGKLWPKLWEIRLMDKTHNANGSLQAVRKICNIGGQGFQ